MKIYFCGSMTFDHSKAADYKLMIERLNNYGEVLNEFVADNIVVDTTPEFEYNRDKNNLDLADVLVADITVVSTGVGFEIGYFTKFNKPMLLLYDINKPFPSSLVRGVDTAKVVCYRNIEEALEIIDKFMKNTK